MFQNFVGNQTGLKHWIQDWVWSILALETFYSQLWSGVVHCAWQLRNLVNKNTIGSFFVVEPFIGRGVCQHTTPEGFFISGKTALVSSNSRSLSWKVPESTARGLVNGSGAKDEYVCFDFGSLKVRAGVAYLQCVCARRIMGRYFEDLFAGTTSARSNVSIVPTTGRSSIATVGPFVANLRPF